MRSTNIIQFESVSKKKSNEAGIETGLKQLKSKINQCQHWFQHIMFSLGRCTGMFISLCWDAGTMTLKSSCNLVIFLGWISFSFYCVSQILFKLLLLLSLCFFHFFDCAICSLAEERKNV